MPEADYPMFHSDVGVIYPDTGVFHLNRPMFYPDDGVIYPKLEVFYLDLGVFHLGRGVPAPGFEAQRVRQNELLFPRQPKPAAYGCALWP